MSKTPDFLKIAQNIKRNIRVKAGKEAVAFFKESFLNEGFTNESLEPWQKSKGPLIGKRTLYKRGNLMRSIHISKETDDFIVITSDTDYSEIHNNGGEITVTEKMKKYFWSQYYLHGGKAENSKNKKSKQNTLTRAGWCKTMALKKVGSKIKIPKRQFMGHSKSLFNKLDNLIANEIINTFINQ